MSTKDFKNMVKEKVRLAAYKDLEVKKSSHEKVKDIVHFNLNHPQKYLTESRLDNNEKSMLYNLRSKSENEFKQNFPNRYPQNNCPMCGKAPDSQEHALSCQETTQKLNSYEQEILSTQSYSDLFSTLDKQVAIAKTFSKIILIRKQHITQQNISQAPHGFIVDLANDV